MKIIKSIIKNTTIPLIVALIVAVTIFTYGVFGEATEKYTYKPIETQRIAHEIAEHARLLGLPENDPIIVRAKELWQKADEDFCNDRDIIATVVYNEAGGGCTDRHMELVAAVVYNRLISNRFPNTIKAIVAAPKQYHPDYANPDSYLGKRARESDVWEKCQEIATKALNGEIECPTDVFYQANFIQGTGIYEIHRTSYSVTWFCYGR